MKNISKLWGAWVLPVAVLLDRLTKAWAARSLGAPIDVLKGALGFRYVENTGAAFSLFSDSTLAVSVVTIILIVGVILYIFLGKDVPKAARLGLWLVVAGGAGNLYDRLVYGYVVDFIEFLFVNFAVFNVADICVTCGAAITVIAFIAGDKAKGKKSDG